MDRIYFGLCHLCPVTKSRVAPLRSGLHPFHATALWKNSGQLFSISGSLLDVHKPSSIRPAHSRHCNALVGAALSGPHLTARSAVAPVQQGLPWILQQGTATAEQRQSGRVDWPIRNDRWQESRKKLQKVRGRQNMELKSKLVFLLFCVGVAQGSVFNFVSKYMGFLRTTAIFEDWTVSDQRPGISGH